jgi:hypothetical protein
MPGESPKPSAASGIRGSLGRTAVATVLAAGLAAYGVYLYRHACFAVGGSDSSGYANAARAILEGRLVVPIEPLERLDLTDSWSPVFVPLGMVVAPSSRTMAPFYPAGFPLHVAAAVALLGWDLGPYVVSPLAALVALVLMYLVGRELELPGWLALGGSALLAASPVMVFQAIQPMSDVVATAWSLAAILAALRSRRRSGWAALAGLSFGVAVLVRPGDAILALPLLFALRTDRRSLALFVLGGAPCAAVLFAYDAVCYGSPLRTGYGLTGHWQEFALAHFPIRFRNYASWTSRMVGPIVAVGSLAALVDRGVPRRDRLMLLSWFGVFLLLHGFYGPADAWWYTRYLLPGLPAIPLAFLLAVRDLVGLGSAPGWRRAATGVGAAVLFLVARAGFGEARSLGVLEMPRWQAAFPEGCRRAAELFPPDALVVSKEMSGALKYYTRLPPVRWDALNPAAFRQLRSRCAESTCRIYALVMVSEVREAVRHVPGPWELVEDEGAVSLWRLGSGNGGSPR